jgi:hypothetical protein
MRRSLHGQIILHCSVLLRGRFSFFFFVNSFFRFLLVISTLLFVLISFTSFLMFVFAYHLFKSSFINFIHNFTYFLQFSFSLFIIFIACSACLLLSFYTIVIFDNSTRIPQLFVLLTTIYCCPTPFA